VLASLVVSYTKYAINLFANSKTNMNAGISCCPKKHNKPDTILAGRQKVAVSVEGYLRIAGLLHWQLAQDWVGMAFRNLVMHSLIASCV